MSLLNRALALKENLNIQPKGLLNKSLLYLESVHGNFPKVDETENEGSNVDLKEISLDLNSQDFFHEVSMKFEDEVTPKEIYEEPTLAVTSQDSDLRIDDIAELKEKIESEEFDPGLIFDDSDLKNEDDGTKGPDYQIVSEFNLNQSSEESEIPEIETVTETKTHDHELFEMSQNLHPEDHKIKDLEFGIENIPEQNLFKTNMIIPTIDLSTEEETESEQSKENPEQTNLDRAIILQEKYFNMVNQTANDLSTLIINENSYQDLLSVISANFQISKSALLIFNPQIQKFVTWHTINLDQETVNKLSIDLTYNDIYKTLTKSHSVILNRSTHQYNRIVDILSEQDALSSDYQLWIPFVFSSRIIGLFLALKNSDNTTPSIFQIQSMELICRLNGPLLYNIYQQDSLIQQKKKILQENIEEDNPLKSESNELVHPSLDYSSMISEESETADTDISSETPNQLAELNQIEINHHSDIKLNDETQPIITIIPSNIKEFESSADIIETEFDLKSADFEAQLQSSDLSQTPEQNVYESQLPDNNQSIIQKQDDLLSEDSDIDLIIENKDNSFSTLINNDQNIQIEKINAYITRHITDFADNPLHLIIIQIQNLDELKNVILKENYESILKDMNLVIISSIDAYNNFVMINDDFSAYILLTDIHKESALEISDLIGLQIRQFFDETILDYNLILKTTLMSYPDQFKSLEEFQQLFNS